MIKIRLNFSPSGCELNLNQDNINHCYETTTYKSTKKIPLPRELAKKLKTHILLLFWELYIMKLTFVMMFSQIA